MDAKPLILSLDVAGQPMCWLPWQEAARLHAREDIAWTTGNAALVVRGGHNRATGLRSVLEIHSIIAIRGADARRERLVPALTNRALFQRDRHTCLYCGGRFTEGGLTREHVLPRSRGGKDGWANVVTACRRCNQRKGCRTPEEAGMRLLAIPFVPNRAEFLILANRRILADQMDFLRAYTPGHRKAQA